MGETEIESQTETEPATERKRGVEVGGMGLAC